MNWISWTLRMQLLFAIFTHSEVMGQIEELSMEIHTTGRIPCIHNISPELIDFVRWTKSTHGDYFHNGNPTLVAWRGDRIIQDQDYSIDTNFSLVIHEVTAMSMGIYRCTVVPKDATEVSNSDSRLTVYKNPEPPTIAYEILGDDKIEIVCTHGPVFPLLYPNFPFPFHNNRTIFNEDGTYMVSISAVQQFSDSEITLYCSNSYTGQHQSSFLNVYRSHDGSVYVTTHPPESKTTLKHSSIPTGCKNCLRRESNPVLIPETPERISLISVNPEEGCKNCLRRESNPVLIPETPELISLISVNPEEDEERIGCKISLRRKSEETPERISLISVNPEEDEERIVCMQMINRLRNLLENQEQYGMLEELAAMSRAREMTETSTKGANIGETRLTDHITAIQWSTPDVTVM